jgi:uncharacterized protein (TIGR04141 family)
VGDLGGEVGRAQSESTRTTVYRMSGTGSTDACIKAKYLDGGFASQPVDVAGISARLVTGSMENPSVRWLHDLSTLTSTEITLGNSTAAAVLLLPLRDAVYAITYGMGHHLLRYERVEPAFGLRVAARVLNPEDLRTVTRHTLDKRARIDRSSIPSGGDVRAFGLGDLGSVASRVIGRARRSVGDTTKMT